MNPFETLQELRKVQEKHKNDFTPTFSINVSDMARDSANSIEELFGLLTQFCWVPITERLPIGPEYDWVLVKTHFVPEGGLGVPHVAELRNGIWFCDSCEGPMEETLAIKVDAWFDMCLLKDRPIEFDSGEISDGYHTFNSLYQQRLVLSAALFNTYPGRSWKSYRHSDGSFCFGGKYFIVGIDTPNGPYTYHYKKEYWNMFHCKEILMAPAWDGHTDKDVTRLLDIV